MITMLAHFFYGKNSVRGATLLLISTLTLSNILGLVRDRLLAAKIPASALDSYYAAFRLPDLVTNLIVIGAIAVAFIPVFLEIRKESDRAAWQAASAILNAMVLILSVGSILIWLTAPYLMPLIVPDFPVAKLEETISLTRWLALTPVLFGISYLLSGVLNSFQRFTVYAFAPLVYNLSIIIATVLYGDSLGVQGVVYGVVAGAFLHMLIQLPIAWKLGWQWHPSFSITHPAVKKVGTLMVPRMVGLLAMQSTTLFATAIASGWVGAITYFNFANNIQTMPTVVFANSIATALFPALSKAVSDRDTTLFTRQLEQGIRWIIFLLVPATLGVIMLRIQIVRLVLGAGHFDWVATQTTADVLGWFAISLVASGLIPLLARAFYARQNMQTPMNIALVSALITIILSYALARFLPETVTYRDQLVHIGGVASLAIAFSVGSGVNAALLLLSMQKDFQLNWRTINRTVRKVVLAAIIMGIVVQVIKTLVGQLFNLDYASGVLIQTGCAVTGGVLSYLLLVWYQGCDEWKELLNLIKKKTNSTLTSTKPA